MEQETTTQKPYKIEYLEGCPHVEDSKRIFWMNVKSKEKFEHSLALRVLAEVLSKGMGRYTYKGYEFGGCLAPDFDPNADDNDYYFLMREPAREEFEITSSVPFLGKLERFLVERLNLPLLPRYDTEFHAIFKVDRRVYKPRLLSFSDNPLDCVAFHVYPPGSPPDLHTLIQINGRESSEVPEGQTEKLIHARLDEFFNICVQRTK